MMGLQDLLSHVHIGDESTDDDSPSGERPCTETGHNYQFESVYGRFTSRESSAFCGSVTFEVYRKDLERCPKCDGTRIERETIGYIEAEDGELEVVDA